VRAAITIGATGVLLCGGWRTAIRIAPAPARPAFPRAATFVLDREGNEIAAFVGQEDAWFVPLKSGEISSNLKKAIVAVEDRRFFDHHGVDWESAAGAAWEDLSSLHVRRGASTITMQVVRLRDPRPRAWTAKIKQAFLAAQLELSTTKDEILTEYLNRATFGGNLVGAGAASWRYFGKACRDLSLGEAALLAGVPQSPNRMRPDRAPAQARARREHVLQQMLATGAITRDEFIRANAEAVAATWRPLPQERDEGAFGAGPSLAAMVEGHLGERVKATIDTRVQRMAWGATRERWKSLGASGVNSAAVVVVDVPTGEVLASVSISNAAGSMDLTQCARSTGSVLKPFIYATAFEMGVLSPESEMLDSPKAWAGYVPANFDRTFEGKLSAAEALAESRNIPAMVTLARAGIERTIGVIDAAGIHSPERSSRRYGLSLAIGGAEATPMEVAEAYATLARGGVHLPLRITAEKSGPGTRILPEQTCYAVLRCLNEQGRTESIEGADAAAKLDAAWKTGTSNGFRDAWCAAATPRTVVVVWIGNSDGRGSEALIGQEAAAPLALKLIGMVDAGGPAWPASTQVSETAVASHEAAMKLAIVSPAAGTEIFSEETPTRVGLTCAGGTGAHRWWFANGELIATESRAQPARWSPKTGTYDLRVVDEAGAAAKVRVVVH
jgi:penicillin-binding protein 1C